MLGNGIQVSLVLRHIFFIWKRKDAENKEQWNAGNFQFLPADPHSTLFLKLCPRRLTCMGYICTLPLWCQIGSGQWEEPVRVWRVAKYKVKLSTPLVLPWVVAITCPQSKGHSLCQVALCKKVFLMSSYNCFLPFHLKTRSSDDLTPDY